MKFALGIVVALMVANFSLGVSQTIPPPLDPCNSYTVLNEASRSILNLNNGDLATCDSGFNGEWYRFMEPAGIAMLTAVPPSLFRCGTDAPMWMNGTHPAVSDGVVSRQACVFSGDDTCGWETTIQVKTCRAGHYVYKLPRPPICNTVYCGHTPVNCPNLSPPVNGDLSPSDANTYPDVVTFRCDQGYRLDGSTSATCQLDGTWSASVPTCVDFCSNNIVLNEAWRSIEHKNDGNLDNCDRSVNGEWYRFMEPAGTVMPTEPPPGAFRCGTDAPVWMNGTHPTLSDGVVSRQACVFWDGNPCNRSTTLQVKACRDGHYVYKLPRLPFCNLVYCGHTPAVKCQLLTAPTNGARTPATRATSSQDVVTFTCNPGYVLNGVTSVTCQADGTWSNPVPTCTPRQCRTLTALTNGALSPTGANSYLDTVTFTCNSGYFLNGAPSTTCQADGSWSNLVPTCTPRQCPPLTAPTNGVRSPTTGANSYLNTVTFTCNAGYVLKGASATTCLADGTWSNFVPSCTPRPCPTLTPPANGKLSPPGPHVYPATVTFTCNLGYTRNGAATTTCQADGRWSNSVPTCILRQCPALTAPANGALSTGVTSYQTRVTTTCNSGYVRNGASDTFCQADGTWSNPVPTCTPRPCPTLTAPANGALSPPGPHVYRNVVFFTCNSGYVRNGAATTRCQADGSWSNPTPPTCIPGQCSTLAAPANGARTPPTGATSLQDTVTFTCNAGYQLIGAETSTCRADGTWSNPVPTCTPRPCQTLTAPANGQLIPAGPHTFSATVIITCNLGYVRNGAADTFCQADGSWSNPVPTCTPRQCPLLTAPANGALSTAARTYQTEVIFTCNSGYTRNGAAATTCQADGTWSNPVPTCTLFSTRQCALLTAPTNGTRTPPTGANSYQDVVTFVCNQGYQLNGASSLTCRADGSWTSSVPTCTPRQCQLLTAPTNGARTPPTGANSYQDEVTFVCNQGYQLNGASSVTCQADGSWTSSVPTCTPRQCQLLTAPTNGTRTPPTGANSYQNVITFTCNPGYQLNGASSVTCQADGTWNNPVPTCTPRQCPLLTAPTNGTRTPPTGSAFFQDVITFSCNQGYQLNGASSVTCKADGTWSNPAPMCTRFKGRQCPALTAPTNGTRTPPTGANSYQDTVTFTCNTGYDLDGAATATCRADGQWSNPAPICTLPPEVRIRPSEIQNLVIGETVTITCNTTGFPSDYNYQWTVDGTVVPSQGSPVFRYKAVSGVHKIRCKVTGSGGEVESENSTVTVLPEGTMTFVSSIRTTTRNFIPEMTDPNSAAFRSISIEIVDWYQQAVRRVQGQVSIRVKALKPGSVIATQNIYVQDSLLQDKDLYNSIYNALRTAAQSPSSLGVDPNNVTLLSATTCYGETVTVTDSSSSDVTLTFPSSAGDTHAYSTQRCADNTASAGNPLAVRRCMGSFQTGVSWASLELLDCDLNLAKLVQMPVTPDNVAEVALELQILTSIGESLTVANIIRASIVLYRIANTSRDENVGYSLVVSVDQIMNADDGVLYQSQVQGQAPSRIVQAIETFNDRVNLTTNRFRRIEQNIGVETYQIGAGELINGVGFASLEGSEALEDDLVRSYSDSSFIPYDRVDASIALPEELGSVVAFLKGNILDPSDVEVRLNFIIYQNSRLFQSNQTASSLTGTKTRVNSRVIASRVTGFKLKNLTSPVVTRYLPIVENSTNSTYNTRCVFWDFDAGGGGGAWSTEGCDFVGIDHNRVVCECNHLTNFAVLVDIYGGLHSFALDLISKIGIALSITGLSLTLIVYLVFKQIRQPRPQRILINLCVALLATLIIFLAGIDATSSPFGCTVVAFLLHYFLLAVFMWMAVEAFNMYLAFVKVLGTYVSTFLLKATILAWGLPFVIAVITLVVDVPDTYPDGQETYRSTNFCWLLGKQLYFGFLLPAGLVLLFNTIVYIMVISRLACRGRTEGEVIDPQKGATTQQLRIAIAVMVLVGLTWIFGFFMISDGRIVFSYLFCIFNSLQGFFIFIFQCLRQKEIQILCFKFCGCPADDSRTAKVSSNQTESNTGGYRRGQRKGSSQDTMPVNIPMNSI